VGQNDDKRTYSDSGRRNIALLGGYGAVGRVVATRLAELNPDRVVVAGRNGDAANAFADGTPGVIARRVDVTRPADLTGVLDDAAVVVMCVESANADVAEACLRRGVHYVDISATSSILTSVQELDSVAKASGATGVLSVGLAPGLTNLLGRLCVNDMPAARSLDIALLLGVDGEHGMDSVRWTVDGLLAPTGPVGRARVDLPGYGRRYVHPFPFSDQQTLSKSLGIPVTTRICFDSAFLTRLVFSLRTVGVFALLRRIGGRRLLTAAFHRVRYGSDEFVVKVTASKGEEQCSWVARGHDTCRATGLVTALTAQHLYAEDCPPGVVHLENLVDPFDLVGHLRRYDVEATRSESTALRAAA
jgi:hypothetical protein